MIATHVLHWLAALALGVGVYVLVMVALMALFHSSRKVRGSGRKRPPEAEGTDKPGMLDL